jgi:hypothetical protein
MNSYMWPCLVGEIKEFVGISLISLDAYNSNFIFFYLIDIIKKENITCRSNANLLCGSDLMNVMFR